VNRYSATTLAFSPGELSTSQGLFISSVANLVVLLDGFTSVAWTQATFGDA
jgi:hypothetical protein